MVHEATSICDIVSNEINLCSTALAS